MLLQVKKSEKSESFIVSLNGAIGFVDERDEVVVGEFYEFMITGYTNKLNKDGNPAAVFLRRVTEDDILIVAPILECEGSMCSTSTYHPKYSMIYPGHRTPVPEVDNVNSRFNEVPYFPTPEIEMWIRKHPKRTSYMAIGVNRYEDINPVFHKRPEIARGHAIRHDMHEAFKIGIRDKSISLVERYDAVREKHGVIKTPLNGYIFKE